MHPICLLRSTALGAVLGLGSLAVAACSQQAVPGDEAAEEATTGMASVTFAVAYRERVALGPGAVAEAQLLAFEPGSDQPELIAEARESFDGRQVPLDLTVEYDPAAVGTDRELAVTGRIVDPDGSQVWVTPEDARFPAGSNTADLGVIMLIRSHHAGTEAHAYVCEGGEEFLVRYDSPELYLTIDEVAYRLSSVAAASGARFEATGEEGPRVFWSRGAGAMVRFEEGGDWVECETSAYLPDPEAETVEAEEEEPATPPVYTARGNEPGWTLRLTSGAAEYTGDYGETRLAGRVSGREALNDITNRLTIQEDGELLFSIEIGHAICQDTMTGLSYPDQVSVTIGSETVSGCGGDPESLLAGEVWRVTHVDGVEVPGPRAVTMEFDGDGRLSGQAPCNRYSAPYQMTGEGIVLGQGVSTRMACAPELMELEQSFLTLIQGSLPASIDDEGTLNLGEGRIIAVRE